MGEPYANEISQRIQTSYDFTYMYVESNKTKHVNNGGKTETDCRYREQQGLPEGGRFGNRWKGEGDQVMCNCCGWTLLYAALAGRRNVKICWMNERRMNEWMDGWLEERSLNFSVFTTALQSVTVGVMIARNRQCSYSIHSPRTIHPTCWKHQGTRQLSRERCTLRGVINAWCGQMPNACIPSVSKHLLNDFATPGPKLRAGVEQRKTSPNLPAFMELTL